jgi:hypothetical protein
VDLDRLRSASLPPGRDLDHDAFTAHEKGGDEDHENVVEKSRDEEGGGDSDTVESDDEEEEADVADGKDVLEDPRVPERVIMKFSVKVSGLSV